MNTRCGEPAVVSTAAVPGPPLRVTNVKGTAVPAPSPVIVAVPERVTVWSFTTAELIVPVTYMALTVNDPLPAPVPTGGANARHSKLPDNPAVFFRVKSHLGKHRCEIWATSAAFGLQS